MYGREIYKRFPGVFRWWRITKDQCPVCKIMQGGYDLEWLSRSLTGFDDNSMVDFSYIFLIFYSKIFNLYNGA